MLLHCRKRKSKKRQWCPPQDGVQDGVQEVHEVDVQEATQVRVEEQVEVQEVEVVEVQVEVAEVQVQEVAAKLQVEDLEPTLMSCST
jgi:hypothetical protein